MTAFGLRTFVVAVAAAALLLAAPAAAVPKRLQALRRTRTRTTACAHPIGDFVFFDATNKAGALGDDSQYTNEFMPFIMCQFPTAQNLDFVRLYGKTACPTFDWADAEGEAAKWLKQIDSNGSKYGAISVSRTLYSALAVLFSKDKALDLWQDLHVPSNFPDRWREKQKAADRHMFALNNFVVQHLVQHAGVDVAAGAGKVLTVSVEDQVKTATDALKTYGDSKIQSKDPHHRNLIANTIAFECASAQAGHIYLGRAIDKPGFDSGWRIDDTNGDSKPNSLSFCGSLMAGFIGDSSACTYELSQTAKVTYAVSISIADYMAQANARVRAFFIPAIPTLMALYAKGEMWHPRSKFCSPDSYESTVGGVATNRPSMVNAKKLTALRVPCNDDTIGFAVSIHTHLFGAGGPTILAAATTATINVQDYSTAIKQAMEKFVTRWTKMKKEVYLVPVSTGEGSTAESPKDVDMHVKQVKTSTVAKEEKTPTLSTVVVHSKKEVDTTENSTEKKNTTEKKPSVSVSLTSTKVVQQKVVQQHVPVLHTSSVSSVRDFWRKKEEELQKKQTTTTDKKTTI